MKEWFILIAHALTCSTSIKAVPLVPRSNPFVERMIRTIREEQLDQVLFWTRLTSNENSLLSGSITTAIVHMAESVVFRRRTRGQRYQRTLALNKFRWGSHCHGLFELPAAA